MTVLFITRSPLARSNSTGQTLCNFFDSTAFPKGEYDFHVLTLDSLSRGFPEAGFVDSTLSIGSLDLLRALRGRPLPTPTAPSDGAPSAPATDSRVRRRIKASTTLRYLAYIPRDLLWWGASSKWKRAVRDYVAAVCPDVVFCPTSGQGYHHRVLAYVRRLTAPRARLVLYHGDDHYTLVTGSPNPVFYPRRLAERLRIRRAVKWCDAQLGASEWQCRAYEAGMGKPCTFISKSLDFSAPPTDIPSRDRAEPLSFVYTGNILLGRWDSLVYLAELLDRLSTRGQTAILTVYSANPLTEHMKATMTRVRSLRFAGAVPPEVVPALQRDADVLVHAESFARTHRAIVRQSFSTKLVDYFYAARPIVAVGPGDVASVAYLAEHDASLCLSGKRHAADDLEALARLFDPAVRREYAARAYEVGREGHEGTVMRGRLVQATFPTRVFLPKPLDKPPKKCYDIPIENP